MTADNDSERQSLPIRVLVANMSGILLEIVLEVLQQQSDMTVSHYEKDLAGLALAVEDRIDVLIWGALYAYPPPAICRDLWHSFPALKIFVLTPSGDPAIVYWLSVQQQRLKAISANMVAETIRRVHLIDLTAE